MTLTCKKKETNYFMYSGCQRSKYLLKYTRSCDVMRLQLIKKQSPCFMMLPPPCFNSRNGTFGYVSVKHFLTVAQSLVSSDYKYILPHEIFMRTTFNLLIQTGYRRLLLHVKHNQYLLEIFGNLPNNSVSDLLKFWEKH